MQFHYVVFYDTDKKKWGVESDVDAYFPDGHVWDESLYKETSYGFRGTEVGPEDGLDETIMNTLYSIVDIIPIPKEYEND
jgi:hypothetical protein